MRKRTLVIGMLLAFLMMASAAIAQRDKNEDEEPTSWLNFVVVKDDNGKPVRNAAVVMHPVNARGQQEKGGMELKTNADGKADFDGIPYGLLRVQVLAQGFQTYGGDFDIDKPKMEITVKLKRPQQQYSVYDDHPRDTSPPPKQDAPPPQQKDQKPN
ncbi:MAG TPA: carboxypeptidase-like regulatory domain-containing protein [Candidatus Sulfotelmatobacter sp.]|nr:carboxypeptidase-like regulatory domain-containing protein [Candidatus Sulfotelmatobacter sp.]